MHQENPANLGESQPIWGKVSHLAEVFDGRAEGFEEVYRPTGIRLFRLHARGSASSSR